MCENMKPQKIELLADVNYMLQKISELYYLLPENLINETIGKLNEIKTEILK